MAAIVFQSLRPSAPRRLSPSRLVPALPAHMPADPHEQLVRQHLRGVWRFLRMLGCRPDEADDLTQETFVVALRKGTGDRSPPEVAAFLRRTARHLFLRSRQLHGRRAALLAQAAERIWARTCPDDAADGDCDGDGDRAVAALRECVAGLGGRARQIVRLFYGEGRSRVEVADVLGMQEAGVKTALQRLRATLSECLQRRLQ